MAEKGHVEAAEVLDTVQDLYEQAEELANELPEDYRVVEVYPDADVTIERITQYGPYWVKIAVFTADDARYEWAVEIAKGFDSDYRALFDYTNNEVVIEKQVDE